MGEREAPGSDGTVRVANQLRGEFPQLVETFIQPASRRDSQVRDRVRRRYGHALADE